MERKETGTAQFYVPFPRNSVTLISSPTYSGKTYFVQQIIKQSECYFAEPLQRVVVILSNPRVEFELDEKEHKIELVKCSLQDFEEDILQPGDFVIVEDIQFISEQVKNICNVLCHHLNLIGVVLICQGLLGQKRLFPLLSLSHRIILFLANTACIRLSKFIIQSCYQDTELKNYLKTILSHAEREKAILLLELNPVSGSQQPFYIAISRLDNFPSDKMPRPLIFAHPSKNRLYVEEYGDNAAEMDESPEAEDLPKGSFVLVPSENIIKRSSKSANAGEDDCEKHWNEMIETIQDTIEHNFTGKKLMLAQNLLREILSSKQFCISASGKRLIIKNAQKHKVSLLDFVTQVLRHAAPNEQMTDKLMKYLPFVKILLQNDAPTHYFKNQLLLRGIQSKRKRVAADQTRPIKMNHVTSKRLSIV
jgi:hypothetical protein